MIHHKPGSGPTCPARAGNIAYRREGFGRMLEDAEVSVALSMPSRILVAGVLLLVLSLACGTTAQVTNTPQVLAPSPSVEPVGPSAMPTLRPPLADLAFPTDVVPYPTNWPAELVYPNGFMPVEAIASLPEGSLTAAWGTKLRYQGAAVTAAKALADFFLQRGWTVNQAPLDSGGFVLLVEDKESHSGIIVIDPDLENPGWIRVIATIYR
jgi:hypothetical protein